MFSLTATSRLEVHALDKSSSLYTLVKALPSVSHGHILLDWFRSWPHVSTIYSATANFEKVDHIYYKRYVLEHKDGGNNALDFAVRTTKDLSLSEYESSGSPDLPARTKYMSAQETEAVGSTTEGLLIVLLHGLAGGSHEHYVRKTVTALLDRFPDDSTVSVVAFNARGCARSKVTSSTYWSALQTDDIAASLDYLHDKFPNRRVVGVGYSLGANILVSLYSESIVSVIDSSGKLSSTIWCLRQGRLGYIGLESMETRRIKRKPRIFMDRKSLLSPHGSWSAAALQSLCFHIKPKRRRQRAHSCRTITARLR